MRAPSSKIGLLIIIVVIVVTGSIAINEYRQAKREKALEELAEQQRVTLKIGTEERSDIDSDNDGLFDWQEELAGSDPENADTDGDGTEDGDELIQGRDPKKAGPNDYYEDEAEKNKELLTKIYPDYVEGNLTDKVGKDLFLSVVDLKNSGQLNAQTQTELINNLVADVETQAQVADKYKAEDIFTVPNDNENIRNYANDFETIKQVYVVKILNTKNPDQKIFLQELSNIYSTWAVDLAKLSVPQALTSNHLEITNTYEKLSNAIKIINDSNTEPILGLFGIQLYEQSTESLPLLYTNIAQFIKKSDIIFTSDEPGYFWISNFEQ